MKKKVYIETTIPSYLVRKPSKDIIVLARQEITSDWWIKYKDYYELFISPEVLDEAKAGNPDYAKQRNEFLIGIKNLEFTEEIENLGQKYFKYFSLPYTAARDALHIAFAVHYELDFLLTWNCRHLANADILQKLYVFNQTLGLKTPIMCTPDELIPIEEE